jgi:threonine aldolase
VSTIDLRSDTVTMPSPAMREAMYRAELGDDVYREDPTVNRLEEMAAERLGKEAGLFVVSGTMGNLVALLTHCARGDEVILGDHAHIFLYEAGGISALGGAMVHTVPNLPNGMLDPVQVEAAVRDTQNVHFPRSRVICLENTHNRCGGAALSPEQIGTIKAVADRHGLRMHLDGARIFNAAVALGVDVAELAAPFDSVQFCFSKGLAAPVGSAIVGSKEFIEQARRNRKIVGGGMRQAGAIAAAAIVALEQMVDRLADDHANAKRLAEGLAEIPGVDIDPSTVQTNIVIFGLRNPKIAIADVTSGLAAEGIQMNAISPTQFRAVTHYGIERDDIDKTLVAFRKVMGALA